MVNATNDITLEAGSRIDLSGQPSTIQTATVYGFGGTAIFNSAQGGLTQDLGSVIDGLGHQCQCWIGHRQRGQWTRDVQR